MKTILLTILALAMIDTVWGSYPEYAIGNVVGNFVTSFAVFAILVGIVFVCVRAVASVIRRMRPHKQHRGLEHFGDDAMAIVARAVAGEPTRMTFDDAETAEFSAAHFRTILERERITDLVRIIYLGQAVIVKPVQPEQRTA